MIVIHRGKEPGSLLKYRKSSPDACYEELPKETAADIHSQMWNEQKGLCAYCMKRIHTPDDVRIEHYNARHPDSGDYHAEETLDFKKMLAVCYGNSFRRGNPDEQTCDAHKGNTPLTVNPFDIASIRKIKYLASGYITSDDPEIRNDVETTLNLNCQAVSLPEARKRVLNEAQRQIWLHCKGKSHEAYLDYIKKVYRHYTVQRELTPYCGIIIAWLEKELKIV